MQGFTFALPAEKVLSDEVKRKQYDLGFDPSRGRTGQQQHYRAGAASVDPEELFRRIFGEFADFGRFNSFFDERPEVRWTPTAVLAVGRSFMLASSLRSSVSDGAHVFGGGDGCR